MKKIIVPVDFSDTSLNAAEYAFELARQTWSEITLVHAWRMPVAVPEGPALADADIEKDALKELQKLQVEMSERFPKILTHAVNRLGFASEVINEIVKEQNADLIVMGIRGHSGIIDQLTGSVTTSMLENESCPVLVIPPLAKFSMPASLVMCCDHTTITSPKALKAVKYFAKLFKASVSILEIGDEKHQTSAYIRAMSEMKLHVSLMDVSHTSFYKPGDHTLKQIEDFVQEKKADWIIMFPHRYSFLQSLFHKSNTRQMAFHTHIPMLSIHD